MNRQPFKVGIVAGGSTVSETRFLAIDGGQIAYDHTGGNGPLILAIPDEM